MQANNKSQLPNSIKGQAAKLTEDITASQSFLEIANSEMANLKELNFKRAPTPTVQLAPKIESFVSIKRND